MESNAPIATSLSDHSKQGKGKGLVTTTVVASVVAICGIGFGIYGMVNMNTNKESVEIPASDSQTTINEPNNQALSAYETNDLRDKTLRLLGSRNGLSIRDYYDDNTGEFMVLSGYMPISELVANELDDSTKTYITLETTMLDKDKYCNYQSTEDVKADIDAALGRDVQFGYVEIDCISYNKANNDYYSLWGENMPKLNGTSSSENGDFAYGSNSDTYYYHIIGGRGGAGSSYVVGKVKQINKDQDYAYVEINAGSFSIGVDNPGKLYSGIGFETEELDKVFEEDSVDSNGLGLTEDDYDALQSYRLIFKKNSNGIYSFSAVEKL